MQRSWSSEQEKKWLKRSQRGRQRLELAGLTQPSIEPGPYSNEIRSWRVTQWDFYL